jgi:hypothetical protein
MTTTTTSNKLPWATFTDLEKDMLVDLALVLLLRAQPTVVLLPIEMVQEVATDVYKRDGVEQVIYDLAMKIQPERASERNKRT